MCRISDDRQEDGGDGLNTVREAKRESFTGSISWMVLHGHGLRKKSIDVLKKGVWGSPTVKFKTPHPPSSKRHISIWKALRRAAIKSLSDCVSQTWLQTSFERNLPILQFQNYYPRKTDTRLDSVFETHYRMSHMPNWEMQPLWMNNNKLKALTTKIRCCPTSGCLSLEPAVRYWLSLTASIHNTQGLIWQTIDNGVCTFFYWNILFTSFSVTKSKQLCNGRNTALLRAGRVATRRTGADRAGQPRPAGLDTSSQPHSRAWGCPLTPLTTGHSVKS